MHHHRKFEIRISYNTLLHRFIMIFRRRGKLESSISIPKSSLQRNIYFKIIFCLTYNLFYTDIIYFINI